MVEERASVGFYSHFYALECFPNVCRVRATLEVDFKIIGCCFPSDFFAPLNALRYHINALLNLFYSYKTSTVVYIASRVS